MSASPIVQNRSLKELSAGLKLIAVTQSLLWFVAGYAGLYAAMLAWMTALAFLLGLLGVLVGDAQLLIVALIMVPLAGCCLAIGLAASNAANSWRHLRGHYLLFVVPAIVCLPGVLLSLMIYAPGVLGRRRLRQTCIDGSGTTVADALVRDGSLESIADHEQRRAHRRAITSIFIKYGGIVCLITIVTEVITTVIGKAQLDRPTAVILSLVFIPVSLFTAFVLSSRLTQRLHSHRALLAPASEEARASDLRPPILLLRSFGDESQLSTFGRVGLFSVTRSVVNSLEEHITDRLWRFGPVIALGRPGDEVAPVGAAREYLPPDAWKPRFSDLARSCSCVVLVASNTPGVIWEIQHIMENRLDGRLLIVVPPWMGEGRWSSFCEAAKIARTEIIVDVTSRRNRLLGLRFWNGEAIAYRGRADQFGYEALSIVATAGIINTTEGSPTLSFFEAKRAEKLDSSQDKA